MIAKVAFPISITGIFDYRIPDKFAHSVVPGVPVKVYLRNRSLWGVVVGVAETSSIKNLKEIIDLKSEEWSESCGALIQYYKWIALYYQSELGKVFKPLIRKKFAEMKPKTLLYYHFSGTIPGKLTPSMQNYAQMLQDQQTPLLKKDIQQKFNLSDYALVTLVKKGVLVKEKRELLREASEINQSGEGGQVTLTNEQSNAVNNIWTQFSQGSLKPILLFGVTGSGKTHVYIELAKKSLANGKNVIILVPEISLTPQTIQRFKHALGSEIAVIHSRMSEGERRDSVEELVAGRKRVVIGVRSAILVPLNNVGLIIVDEEHDGSYKQSDPEPRYHARDVAVMRGHFQKALVVLGSATPSFESYYNAQKGKYIQIALTQRFGKAALPQVELIDMNEEHRHNNWTFLSRYLHQKIEETLNQKRQVILLLNRRGFSISLICKECGFVYTCPSCSVNLVYHRTSMHLQCHQCGYTEYAPSNCKQCNGEQIKYRGTGIQKAEEFLKATFPTASIIRMDLDTTRRKDGHLDILRRFSQKQADILLGTQMVAKGLNFPGVKLVGVLQADTGLHFPDFRASERTHQLLSQVAGRAGRKDNLGEVVIQTYSPNEPAIIAAKTHDFPGFYQQEIETRKQLHYPPFSRLIRLVVQGKDELAVEKHINTCATFIKRGKQPCTILGPSPAILTKISSSFRYSLLIKTSSPHRLQQKLFDLRKKFPPPSKDMRVTIDVDPNNML